MKSHKRAKQLISTGIMTLLALSFLACQTTGVRDSRKPPSLSPGQKSLFSVCKPADGAFSLAIFHKGQQIARVQSEWVSLSNGSWQIQTIDDFGRTLLDLHWKGPSKVFEKSGVLSEKVKDLKFAKHGHLVASGFDLGLKANEIPCILSSSLPKSWMNAGRISPAGNGESILELRDQYRQIVVKLGKYNSKEICTRLMRRKWFDLFVPEVNWCFKPTNLSGSLRLGSDYQLEWGQQS